MFKRANSYKNSIGMLALSLFLTMMIYAQESIAVQLDCMIKPEAYIELGSPVTGILQKVFVNKGDKITEGQPLVQLEASVELARVNQAKFDAADLSEIANRKAKLEFAKRTFMRHQALKHDNIVSKLDLDKLDTEVSIAESELNEAVQEHKAAELTLEFAKAQLNIKTIRSPINGLVIDRYIMVGEAVNDEKAIMKLVQVEPLRIELIAPTEFFGLIKKDMEADIRPERPTDKTYRAKVTQIDSVIDPASGSFAIRMALIRFDPTVISGVNCTAIFDFELKK
jgi:RND family efflux transporter MFP subunit